MNATKPLGAAIVAAAIALGTQVGGTRPVATPGAAATYENLANAIIAIRETENSLVRGIITSAFDAALTDLDAAADSSGGARRAHLESAAMAITEIATEGDKAVQAVRQRLLRAGHHHHTDAETEADYIFVDSREKKELLELARSVSRLGPDAPHREVLDAARNLRDLFARVMAAE